MRAVVDANIIFSLMLSGSGKFLNLIFNEDIKLAAPNFIIIELFKHKEKIRKHSKLSEEEMLELMTAIADRISFFPVSNISKESFNKAVDICRNVDEKDIPYVALALELDASLMTGDAKLKRHLRNKHPEVKLYNF
jgi:putative PIN family toxin of toxin-antitoxin system